MNESNAQPDSGASDQDDASLVSLNTTFLALIFRGGRWNPRNSPETRNRDERHLAYLLEMQQAGKILTFGPVADIPFVTYTSRDLQGIILLKAESRKEALSILRLAPNILAAHQRFELRAWIVADPDSLT